MALTLNLVPYNLYRFAEDKSTYVSESHSDLDKDVLILRTGAPTRRATDFGNRRSNISFIEGHSVPDTNGDTVEKDSSLSLSASLPVGVTWADFYANSCARMQSMIADEALFRSIVEKGAIQQ